MLLPLNDQQLATIMQAASLLPLQDRDRFLRSVANRLDLNGGSPSDRDLAVAISFVLEGRGIAAKLRMFCNNMED
jgi:hypothetical protein